MRGMDMSEMKKLTRVDTAIEALSIYTGSKINSLAKEIKKPKEKQDPELIKKIKTELIELNKERRLMYSGDEKTINKILNTYSPIIKREMEKYKKDNER